MPVSLVDYPAKSDQSVRAFRTRDLIEVHSSLGQTSALHMFSLTTLLFPFCMVKGTLTGLSFDKDLTENQRD